MSSSHVRTYPSQVSTAANFSASPPASSRTVAITFGCRPKNSGTFAYPFRLTSTTVAWGASASRTCSSDAARSGIDAIPMRVLSEGMKKPAGAGR